MEVRHFFDPDTFTLTYLVFDPKTRDAVLIDPVLDFDPASGAISETSSRAVAAAVKELGLRLHLILETHAHADHLSGSQVIKRLFPQARLAISQRITEVQKTFSQVFNMTGVRPEGKDFDLLLRDEETLEVGSLSIKVIPTPGHTPACTSFLIEDRLFTGDALFMPDYGTGRCDFPDGSASMLFDSISRLYELPESTRVYVGHDYQPGGRELKFMTTIGESKRENIQLKAQTKKDEFVRFREARDKTLKAPRLLLPSLQVNILAGHLPLPESNGRIYLKTPLTIKTEGT